MMLGSKVTVVLLICLILVEDSVAGQPRTDRHRDAEPPVTLAKLDLRPSLWRSRN